jgi:hypothetical protein
LKRNHTAILAIALAASACTGGGGQGARKTLPSARSSSPSPSASPTASATPKPTGEAILFLVAPASGDDKPRIVYRAPADGGRKRPIPLDFREFDQFLSSPNGIAVAQWRDQSLRTGSAAKPSELRTIAAVSEKNTRINAVAWNATGTSLVYITSHLLDPGREDSRVVNRLYRVSADGTGRRLVKTFSEPAYVSLVAFDSKNDHLFWFETGEGGYRFNFSEIDLVTGKTLRRYKELPSDLYFNLFMSRDYRRAYYATSGGKIREFTLSTRAQRTLYQIKGDTPDQYGNKSDILRMHLMPGDREIVFTKHEEPSSKDLTYRLSIETRRVTPLLADPRFHNLAAETVSSSGRYIWFETTCHGCGGEAGYDNSGEYYVLDVASERMITIIDIGPDSAQQPMTVQFLCWLKT